MVLARIFVIFFLIMASVPGQASTCIFNERRPEESSEPRGDADRWFFQKICFDHFPKPEKISVEYANLSYSFFSVTSIRESTTWSGLGVINIKAKDKEGGSKSLKITITKSVDDRPLALVCKDSDGYELVSSL